MMDLQITVDFDKAAARPVMRRVIMTGILAVHLTVGIGILGIFAWRTHRRPAEDRSIPISIVGLYWHFVDLVWVFLFPLLYLNGRSG